MKNNLTTNASNEFWYYFGKCTPYPKQIGKGYLPRMPYKKFNTKEECQEYIDSGEVLPSYSLEEVRELLQKQKEQTIFSLGLSSAIYVYPSDYEIMKEWMMNCSLVL